MSDHAARRRIVALGECIWDNVFARAENGPPRYLGSAGGGSALNLVANVAVARGSAAAAGAAGCDIFGQRARTELAELGVDVSAMLRYDAKATRVLSEEIAPVRDQLLEHSRHRFRARCLVCGRSVHEARYAKFSWQDVSRLVDWSGVAAVCLDRLTKAATQAAHDARSAGAFSVLDVGRVGYLRWFPAAQVASGLRAFDILLLPRQVAASLTRRIGRPVIEVLAQAPDTGLILESAGPSGLTLHHRRRQTVTSRWISPPRAEAIVDDAGAGDALVGGFVRRLIELRIARDQLGTVSFDEFEAIVVAALADVQGVLQAPGARGHLGRGCLQPLRSEWAGKGCDELRELTQGSGDCPFCGSVEPAPARRASPRRRPGARSNVRSYLRARTLSVLERADALERCRFVLRQAGTAYVIGTGGSYPVAVFIAQLLNQHSGLFAQPIHPFDYVRTGRASDYVIVISYSGKTSDCGAAIVHARRLGARHVLLLTGAPNPELASALRSRGQDAVISYGRVKPPARPERGFVSIAGTVAPCALWTAAQAGSTSFLSIDEVFEEESFPQERRDAQSLAGAINRGAPVACFGGGLAWPAMLDVESKFVEGGLGVVQLHEAKDFSHGRFISVMNSGPQPAGILLRVGPSHKYEQALRRALRGGLTGGLPVVDIAARRTAVMGALELLIRVQFFIMECGTALGKDIARPSHISSAGLKLYHWRGDLTGDDLAEPDALQLKLYPDS